MSKDRYLLSFYETDIGSMSASSQLVNTNAELRAKHNGRLLTAPISNEGPIDNPALPSYTSRVPGDLLTVTGFKTQKDLDFYLEDVASLSSELPSGVRSVALAKAKIFKPMPIMPDAPVLGDIDHRPAPAFLLLNGISMNSMLNPMTPIRMMRYMNTNMNKLEAEGVQLLEAFQVTDVIHGDYDFDMLFLTEWPDQATFDQIHTDPEFLSLARKTRNKAFRAFADDKGIIQFDAIAPTLADSNPEK